MKTSISDSKFSCSLILHDLVISDGICVGMDDNSFTITTSHNLPEHTNCLALISFDPTVLSTITLELTATLIKTDLGTFKITIPKDQISWGHFQNLLSYV